MAARIRLELERDRSRWKEKGRAEPALGRLNGAYRQLASQSLAGQYITPPLDMSIGRIPSQACCLWARH